MKRVSETCESRNLICIWLKSLKKETENRAENIWRNYGKIGEKHWITDLGICVNSMQDKYKENHIQAHQSQMAGNWK